MSANSGKSVDCENIMPSLCGNKALHFASAPCVNIRFEGIGNVTISQGDNFDPMSGVHAYNGDGREVAITASVDSLDTCTAGIYTIRYTAQSDTPAVLPSIECVDTALQLTDGCDVPAEATAYRTITIERLPNPVITGTTPIEGDVPLTVDTLDGVSAVDGNGDPITVTASPSGVVEYTSVGVFVITYTAADKCGNTTTVQRTVEVESSLDISPTGVQGVIEPTEGQDGFISTGAGVMRPLVSESTASDALDEAVNYGVDWQSFAENALLSTNLAKYSAYVMYPSSDFDSSIATLAPWEYILQNSQIIEDGAFPVDGQDELDVIRNNMCGWLTLFDVGVDYPVMQYNNNQFYAGHSIYGTVSNLGSIYLDGASSADFSDEYSVIYGHNVATGAMFGSLLNFLDNPYTSAHTKGILVSARDALYDLTLFAVASTVSYDENIYTMGDRADAVKEYLADGTGDHLSIHYFDTATASDARKIIALSTCKDYGHETRLVLFYSAVPNCGSVGALDIVEVNQVSATFYNPHNENIDVTLDPDPETEDNWATCYIADTCIIEGLIPGTSYCASFRKLCGDGYTYYDGEPVCFTTPEDIEPTHP